MSAQGAYSATDTFYLATCTVLYTHQSWRQAQLSHCEHAIFRVTNVTLTFHLKVHSHQCNSNWNELVPNLLRIQFGPSPLSIMNADHHGRWTQIFSSKASKLETSWYVENRNFYLPYLHLAVGTPTGGDTIWILPRSLVSKNQKPWAFVWHCFRDTTFSHFYAIMACDRWMDKHRATAYTTLAKGHAGKTMIISRTFFPGNPLANTKKN